MTIAYDRGVDKRLFLRREEEKAVDARLRASRRFPTSFIKTFRPRSRRCKTRDNAPFNRLRRISCADEGGLVARAHLVAATRRNITRRRRRKRESMTVEGLQELYIHSFGDRKRSVTSRSPGDRAKKSYFADSGCG